MSVRSVSTLCVALAQFAIAATACSDAGPLPRPEQTLTTDAADYSATPVGGGSIGVTVKVITTYANSADTAVTLERCAPWATTPIYGVFLVAPQSPDGAGYDLAWACAGHDHPIVVAAHDTRTDTLMLSGPSTYVHTIDGGHFVGVLDGTFQLSYGQVRSNSFRVHVPSAIAAAVIRRTSAPPYANQHWGATIPSLILNEE